MNLKPLLWFLRLERNKDDLRNQSSKIFKVKKGRVMAVGNPVTGQFKLTFER